MRKEKCKHIFKPIEFAKCGMTPEGRNIYIYQMQCMCCGKKHRFGFFPIYMSFKEEQGLYLPYDIRDKLVIAEAEKEMSNNINVEIFGAPGSGKASSILIPQPESINNIEYIDAETTKTLICNAIDNIPDCAGITDCYTEHSFGDTEAWIKIHIAVKENTDDNRLIFHEVAHDAFNTDMGFIS